MVLCCGNVVTLLKDRVDIAKQTMEQNVEVWRWILNVSDEVVSLAVLGQSAENFLEQIVEVPVLQVAEQLIAWMLLCQCV